MNKSDKPKKDSSYIWLKILGVSSIIVACTLIICAGVMFIIAVCGYPCTSKNVTPHRYVCKHHDQCGIPCTSKDCNPALGVKQCIYDSVIGDLKAKDYLKDFCFCCEDIKMKQAFLNDSIITNTNLSEYIKNLCYCGDDIRINQLLLNDSIISDSKTKEFLEPFFNSYYDIRMEQSLLNDKYETLISDVRQETNNNLDKINTWLAFWIGILAVFGVLAPIVAEYRFRIDNDRKWKNMSEDAHKTFDKYKTLMAAMELESCVNSLTNSYSDRMITGMSERDKIIANLLIQIQSSLKDFMDPDQCRNIDKDSHRCMLLRVLISLFSSVQKMRSWDSFKHQNRQIEAIQDNIRQILKALGQSENIHSKNIEDKMNNIANGIDKLCETIK